MDQARSSKETQSVESLRKDGGIKLLKRLFVLNISAKLTCRVYG